MIFFKKKNNIEIQTKWKLFFTVSLIDGNGIDHLMLMHLTTAFEKQL